MQNNNINLDEFLTSEHYHLIEEIGEYRKSIGLVGLPQYLSAHWIKESSRVNWERQVDTKLNISTAHTSHAQKAIALQRLLFGNNGGKLISSIRSDQVATAAGTFDGKSREMTLDTVDNPNDPWFIFVNIHENIHAADPSLMITPLYPTDMHIRVSHGMAQVLSQANNIEGMFLRNRESRKVPYIKIGIGEGVGTLFLQDNLLRDQVDDAGHELILRTLAEIARDQKAVTGQIIFTKKACHHLGEALLPAILSHRINISGSLLSDWFNPHVESASIEVFADMATTLLMHPEQIGHNPQIMSGVEEILSAIQETPVDIKQLINDIRIEDENIAKRYEAEQAAIDTSDPQSASDESQELEQTEVEAIQEEAKTEQNTQNRIWDFINEGIVPPDIVLKEEDRLVMQQYGVVISKVYERFPEIANGLNADDMSFDPALHIWETRQVAEAWDANKFYNLLTDPTLIPEQLGDVKRRIGVLTDFIANPAFDRPKEQSLEPRQSTDASHADALRMRMQSLLS